jgi:hypothetical protein
MDRGDPDRRRNRDVDRRGGFDHERRGMMLTRHCYRCRQPLGSLCVDPRCPIARRRDWTPLFYLLGLIAAATLIFAIFATSAARAQGACMGVRDYSERQWCLAQTRAQPETCNGVRDYDKRQFCRAQAEAAQRAQRR